MIRNGIRLALPWTGLAAPDGLIEHLASSPQGIVVASGPVGTGTGRLLTFIAEGLPESVHIPLDGSLPVFARMMQAVQRGDWVLCEAGSRRDSWADHLPLKLEAIAHNENASPEEVQHVLEMPLVALHTVWDYRSRSGLVLIR